MKQCVGRVLEQYTLLFMCIWGKSYVMIHQKTTKDKLNAMNSKFTEFYLELMSYVLGLLTDLKKYNVSVWEFSFVQKAWNPLTPEDIMQKLP